MKPEDLQKVGLMVGIIVFILAPRLPFEAVCLVILWMGILAFDSIENRKVIG